MRSETELACGQFLPDVGNYGNDSPSKCVAYVCLAVLLVVAVAMIAWGAK